MSFEQNMRANAEAHRRNMEAHFRGMEAYFRGMDRAMDAGMHGIEQGLDEIYRQNEAARHQMHTGFQAGYPIPPQVSHCQLLVNATGQCRLRGLDMGVKLRILSSCLPAPGRRRMLSGEMEVVVEVFVCIRRTRVVVLSCLVVDITRAARRQRCNATARCIERIVPHVWDLEVSEKASTPFATEMARLSPLNVESVNA